MTTSPILLITFNRPETTQKVFDALRKIKPLKLYVFNDGPRSGNNNDLIAREEIKSIIRHVDWECELITNFSEKNKGCGLGVSGAISWAFENEERLIIVEDDCIPTEAFVDYCNHCLEKYQDNNNVFHIAGNNYTEKHNFTNDDYLFSKYGHIWGWATWKRAWNYFDYDMKDWPTFRDNHLYNVVSSKAEYKYFEELINRYYENPILPWGMRWMFAKFKNRGLSIVPRVNLVQNIGDYGTHTKGGFKFKVSDSFVINSEPDIVSPNERYDDRHFRKHIYLGTRLYSKVYKKLKRIIKSGR